MKTPAASLKRHSITGRLALLGAAVLLPFSAFGADWTGANSNDFADPANWGVTDLSGTPLLVNDTTANISLSSDAGPSNLFVQNGEVTQSSGILTTTGFRVGASSGSPGIATYNMTGGTITGGGEFRVALHGGTGTMNLSNDASVTTTGTLYVGAGGNSVDSKSVGVLSLDGTSSFAVNNVAGVSLGQWTKTGSGTLEVKGNSTFSTTGQISMGASSSGQGIINLSGNGTIVANKIYRGSGSATITANGGTFKAIAAQNNFFENVEVRLLAGGVTIDTQSYTMANITYASKTSLLSGVGGLTKIGTGTLTLNRDQTYTGATKVDEGTLVIAGSVDSTALEVASGATLTLSNVDAVVANVVTLTLVAGSTLNLDFAGDLFVNSITVDGIALDAGIYSTSDGWGALVGIASGTGVITVVPEPSTYALLGAAGLVGLVALRRRRK